MNQSENNCRFSNQLPASWSELWLALVNQQLGKSLIACFRNDSYFDKVFFVQLFIGQLLYVCSARNAICSIYFRTNVLSQVCALTSIHLCMQLAYASSYRVVRDRRLHQRSTTGTYMKLLQCQWVYLHRWIRTFQIPHRLHGLSYTKPSSQSGMLIHHNTGSTDWKCL